MQWFVVHTKPRQEQRALENLQRQGFAAWLPMLSVEKFRRGRLEKVVEPMFSRYLFIRLSETARSWSPIRSTLGVSKLVSFGPHPARVPVELICFLREAPPLDKVQRLFAPGDQVLIIDGPPGNNNPETRYPALKEFKDKLSPNAVVILDDVNREGERKLAEDFEAALPNHELVILNHEKGAAIISPR